MWGISGFDTTAGRFILPSKGGTSITSNSLSAQSPYYFSIVSSSWDAPLSMFHSAQGGPAVYSTDILSLCKELVLAANHQQTVNELFEVEAPGP